MLFAKNLTEQLGVQESKYSLNILLLEREVKEQFLRVETCS